MSDIFTNPQILKNGETPIPMKDAHLHFPTPVSPSRVQQWIRGGVGGVRLGTFSIGRLRYTSEPEIMRFLLAQQNPSVSEYPKTAVNPTRPNPATMTKEEVDSELRRFGFDE